MNNGINPGLATLPFAAGKAARGRMLVADPSQPQGAKWQIADETIVPISAAYHTPLFTGSAAVTLTTTRKYFMPVYLPAGIYTRAACRVSTTVASSDVRLGIYSRSPATGLPTTLLQGGDFGTVDMSTGTLKTLTGLLLVVPADGWYLMACHSNGAVQIRGTSTTGHGFGQFGCDFVAISYVIHALFRDTAIAAMAQDETGNTFTNVFNGTSVPIFGVAP